MTENKNEKRNPCCAMKTCPCCACCVCVCTKELKKILSPEAQALLVKELG